MSDPSVRSGTRRGSSASWSLTRFDRSVTEALSQRRPVRLIYGLAPISDNCRRMLAQLAQFRTAVSSDVA